MSFVFRLLLLFALLALPGWAQNGLVAAFPCNEGTGTTIRDVASTHHIGTLNGATWTTAGKFGKGLVFNGTNAWVTVPEHAQLDLTTGATVMAWVYPTALGNYRTVVMKEVPGGASYYLYSGPGNLALGGGGFNGGTYREIGGGTALALNTWTHLAMTYDGANIRTYRNGVLVGTLASTGPFDVANGPLRIGGNSMWSEWWQGRIDEIRIYNRALSAAEIVSDRDAAIVPIATPPVILSTAPVPGAAVRSLSQIDVQFDEAVTGVDAGDLLVGGVAATGLVPLGGNAYRFTFPAKPVGAVGAVSVAFAAGHGITDTETPVGAFAGGSWSYTVDPNAPLGQVRINEVVAVGAPGGLADADGDFDDWVELQNTGAAAVNLSGWALTDDAEVPGKWVFPARTLAPGGYLIVFLSEKNRTPATGELHASFSLKRGGGLLRLYNAGSPRQLVSALEPLPAQQPGISYGLGSTGQARYLAMPSPGAANGGTEYVGIAVAPTPSVGAGYFTSAFALALASSTPGATVRYTTDGTPPTVASALYAGPLNITGTTVLRAVAFAPNYVPSEVMTRTYLFLADVLTQSPTGAAPPGWPVTWGDNKVDYGMDPDVIGPGAPYQARALGAMQALPALSIVMKLPDLFDASTGIYANAGQNGDAWERSASLELLRPDGQAGFQENGGLRIRGNFSRDTNNPKHSFRMFFRELYGAGKLDYPLFGPGGADKQDVVDLRTSQDFSWAYLGSNAATFVTDSFARDLMGAMGQSTTRGEFYHLFINGQYWGLYNTEERVNPSYATAYFGGADADYDVVKVDSFVTQSAAGTFDAWTQFWNLTEAGVASNAAYEALLGNNADGTRNPALPIQLDPVNLCDYMLMNFVLDNRDGPTYIDGGQPNNFFAVRPRDGRFGWRFFAHDSEYSMMDVNQDVTGPATTVGATLPTSNARRMWEKCMANAEFHQLFADRVQKHCFGNGALTASGQAAIWQARVSQIDQAVIGESARWGDAARATPLTRDTDWVPRINYFNNTWFPNRTNAVIAQLQARGYFPTLAAPAVAPLPGMVEAGTVVTLTQAAPVGVIYYTLDGSDPRHFGGTLSPTAQVWPGSLTLLNGVKLRARVKNGVNWSALVEADYFLSQDLSKLAVSELMFNPPGAGATDGAEFEFIELTNTGNKTIDLAGLSFTEGVTGTFPLGTTVAPGGYVVAVRNPAVFNTRHPGVPVALTYTGKLDNNGETITLAEPGGGVILRLAYNNAPPWPASASGLGFSIVNITPEAFSAPEDGARWRASTALYGSPGAADPSPVIPPVAIGEILAGANGFVELHNLSGSTVSVAGWGLTDDLLAPAKAVIAGGTTIPPNGAVQFSAASLGFTLNPAGGTVFVFARSGGALTGYSHGWKYGATGAAFALGRVVDTTGEEALVPLIAPTPGVLTATPQIGPVVLNEIWYHPPAGYFEAVELRNTSATPVALDGWRIDGFGYTFPTGTSIAGSGYLLVVADDPALFRARHGISAAVPIFGPAVGVLEDSGERLSLDRPSTLTSGVFVSLESVRYNDKAPWPLAADGAGPSLQRVSGSALALEPTNWQGLGLTLGRANSSNVAPTVAITSPVHLTTFAPPGAFTITAEANDPDGQVVAVEFYDGATKIGQDTTAPYSLALTNVGAGQHRLTARAIDDAFATTTSIPVLTTGLGDEPFVVSPWGATWRYRDNGVAPPVNWIQLAYDDSTWKSGPAELGYGDSDEATVVEDDATPGFQSGSTSRYITTWFRRTFTVTDAAHVTSLAGRMIRDDGVAVYLNGVEIWRDNLAAGAGPSTPAINNISGSDEALQITKVLDPAKLVEGVNVLAVEIHQQAADSSDISFNLELSGTRLATAPDPDTDGDGMKDSWEIAHGLAYADASDGLGDADGDGTLNVTEFRLGLDPRNAAQAFRATVAPNGAAGFTVTWPAAAGVPFTIERTLTLSPPNWQTIGTVTPTGSSGTFTDASPLAGRGFYRVRFSP